MGKGKVSLRKFVIFFFFCYSEGEFSRVSEREIEREKREMIEDDFIGQNSDTTLLPCLLQHPNVKLSKEVYINKQKIWLVQGGNDQW